MNHNKLCKLFRPGASGSCECETIHMTLAYVQRLVEEMAIKNHHQPGELLCDECYTIQRVRINIAGDRR